MTEEREYKCVLDDAGRKRYYVYKQVSADQVDEDIRERLPCVEKSKSIFASRLKPKSEEIKETKREATYVPKTPKESLVRVPFKDLRKLCRTVPDYKWLCGTEQVSSDFWMDKAKDLEVTSSVFTNTKSIPWIPKDLYPPHTPGKKVLLPMERYQELLDARAFKDAQDNNKGNVNWVLSQGGSPLYAALGAYTGGHTALMNELMKKLNKEEEKMFFSVV